MPGARWATAHSAGLATPLPRELRPFVAPLGAAAFLGHSAFPLAVLALPATVLLNRIPRLEARSDGTPEGRAVMSVNVMIEAVLILLMTMLLSAFALEATACSVGVPNCD